MIKFIQTAFFLFCLSVSVPVSAQDKAALCALLPHENIAAGADYVPGVDVRGNPVAPANLGGTPPLFDGTIRFPVTVDLAADLAQPLPAGAEMNAPMAFLEVHRDGSVSMNGVDMTEKAHVLCSGDQASPTKDTTKAPEEVMIQSGGNEK